MHFKGIRFIEFFKNNALTVLCGALGSAVVSAAAVYYGLRYGSFLQPFLFAAVLSAALAFVASKTRESARVHLLFCSVTAGTMAAAMLAAVMPALLSDHAQGVAVSAPTYFLSPSLTGLDTYFYQKKIFADSFADVPAPVETVVLSDLVGPLVLIFIAVLLMALTFSWIKKNDYVKRKECDFPEALAAAGVISKADKSKDAKLTKGFLIGGAVGALIAALRELIPGIPFSLETEKLEKSSGVSMGFALSPMLGAFGYVAGFKRSLSMMVGAFFSYVISVPAMMALGVAKDVETASSLRSQMGIGLIIGTGIGVLLDLYIGRLEAHERSVLNGEPDKRPPLASRIVGTVTAATVFVVAYLVLFIAGVDPVLSLLCVVAAYIACHAASVIKGESGVFTGSVSAVIGAAGVVTLDIIYGLTLSQMFLATFFIGAAAALAGHFANSYKVGTILGVSFAQQLVMQTVGAVIGAATALLCFFAVMRGEAGTAQGFSSELREFFSGEINPVALWLPAALSAALTLLKLPAASFSLGAFLPFSYSACFFIGGLLRFINTKRHKKTNFDIPFGLAAGESGAVSLIAVISWIFGA